MIRIGNRIYIMQYRDLCTVTGGVKQKSTLFLVLISLLNYSQETIICILLFLLFFSEIFLEWLKTGPIERFYVTPAHTKLKKLIFKLTYVMLIPMFHFRSFFERSIFNRPIAAFVLPFFHLICVINRFCFNSYFFSITQYIIFLFLFGFYILIMDVRLTIFSHFLNDFPLSEFSLGFFLFLQRPGFQKNKFVRYVGTSAVSSAVFGLGSANFKLVGKYALYTGCVAGAGAATAWIIDNQFARVELRKTLVLQNAHDLGVQQSAQSHELDILKEKNASELAKIKEDHAHKERMAQLQAQQHSGFRSTLKNLWRRE